MELKHSGKSAFRNSEDTSVFKLSQNKTILWDHHPCGPPVALHLTLYKKPKVLIKDRVLGLAARLHETQKTGKTYCRFLGSLTVDGGSVGDGITVILDQLEDTEKLTQTVMPGDIIVPTMIAWKAASTIQNNMEQYLGDLKDIYQGCCSESCLDLANLVKLRASCIMHGIKCNIVIEMSTIATAFKATPIPPISIFPTSLTKTLSGLNDTGPPMNGFVSLDSQKRLVVILETDSKANSLPLVGIWVSGISAVYHPFVWAACVRYISCIFYRERLCLPPQPFLIALYSPLHSQPEFYDCITVLGSSWLTFDIEKGTGITTLAKVPIVDTKITVVELTKMEQKIMEFQEAEKRVEQHKMPFSSSSVVTNTDDMPQLSPHPNIPKALDINCQVPDLSIVSEIGVNQIDPSTILTNQPKMDNTLSVLNGLKTATLPLLPIISNRDQIQQYNSNEINLKSDSDKAVLEVPSNSNIFKISPFRDTGLLKEHTMRNNSELDSEATYLRSNNPNMNNFRIRNRPSSEHSFSSRSPDTDNLVHTSQKQNQTVGKNLPRFNSEQLAETEEELPRYSKKAISSKSFEPVIVDSRTVASDLSTSKIRNFSDLKDTCGVPTSMSKEEKKSCLKTATGVRIKLSSGSSLPNSKPPQLNKKISQTTSKKANLEIKKRNLTGSKAKKDIELKSNVKNLKKHSPQSVSHIEKNAPGKIATRQANFPQSPFENTAIPKELYKYLEHQNQCIQDLQNQIKQLLQQNKTNSNDANTFSLKQCLLPSPSSPNSLNQNFEVTLNDKSSDPGVNKNESIPIDSVPVIKHSSTTGVDQGNLSEIGNADLEKAFCFLQPDESKNNTDHKIPQNITQHLKHQSEQLNLLQNQIAELFNKRNTNSANSVGDVISSIAVNPTGSNLQNSPTKGCIIPSSEYMACYSVAIASNSASAISPNCHLTNLQTPTEGYSQQSHLGINLQQNKFTSSVATMTSFLWPSQSKKCDDSVQTDSLPQNHKKCSPFDGSKNNKLLCEINHDQRFQKHTGLLQGAITNDPHLSARKSKPKYHQNDKKVPANEINKYSQNEENNKEDNQNELPVSFRDIQINTVYDSNDSPESSIHIDIQDYPTTFYSPGAGDSNSEDSDSKSPWLSEWEEDKNSIKKRKDKLPKKFLVQEEQESISDSEENVPDTVFYNNILGKIKRIWSKQSTLKNRRFSLPEWQASSQCVSPVKRLSESGRKDFTPTRTNHVEERLHGNLASIKEFQQLSAGNAFSLKQSCLLTSQYSEYKICETDMSMELNALAAKYLGDELDHRVTTKMLTTRKEVMGCTKKMGKESSDCTLYGISSNLSFATKKYLEKYGLAANCTTSHKPVIEEENTEHLFINEYPVACDPDKVQKTDHSLWLFNKHRRTSTKRLGMLHSEKSQNPVESKVLDIDMLRQQPKLI